MAESSASSTDLWEECFTEGCGKDGRIALTCPCSPGVRTILCKYCACFRRCPHCKQTVASDNMCIESGAPSTLPCSTMSDGYSEVSTGSLNFRIGEFRVVFAPTQHFECDTGYLQYSYGDDVVVLYVGTSAEEAEWVYAENLSKPNTKPNKGWIEKRCIGAKEDLRGHRVFLRGLRRQELNGQEGICEKWVDSSQRWQVILRTGMAVVKEENLVKATRCSEKLSRKLTSVLRHQREKLGLTVRQGNFVPLREVMKHVSCTMTKLMHTIRESHRADKSRRFEERVLAGILHVRVCERGCVPSSSVPSSSSVNGSFVSEGSSRCVVGTLERLWKLKKDGALTEEDFFLAKQRLLR